MEWFYASADQQKGPVSEAQLDDLLRTGAITRDTLVWNSTMTDWQPLGSVRGAAPPPMPSLGVPPTGATMTACAGCGQKFPQSDLVFLNQAWVCAQCKPAFLQRLREGAMPVGGGVWRLGKKLVMRKDTTLPDRCVRCNAPANGYKLKRTLYWHNPAFYLLVLINVLIYLIVALAVRKKAVTYVGLCEAHRGRRKMLMLFGWLGVFAGVAGIVVGGVESMGLLVGLGILVLLAGLIVAVLGASVLRTLKMDKEFVWAKGAGPEFLANFPEWTGT